METFNPLVHELSWFTHCAIFKFPKLVVSVKIFRNPFLILHLDKQHPVWVGEPTQDVGRVTDLFFPLSWNVHVYTHVSVGVFTRLFLSHLVDSTKLQMEHL
jgi:hypothetical protein